MRSGERDGAVVSTFEDLIEELEALIEILHCYESEGDDDTSGRIPLIFERLSSVQNAIDDWRQG